MFGGGAPGCIGSVSLPVPGLCSGRCWGGGVVGEVKQFCYLEDVLECGGGSERAIRARVGAAWESGRK